MVFVSCPPILWPGHPHAAMEDVPKLLSLWTSIRVLPSTFNKRDKCKNGTLFIEHRKWFLGPDDVRVWHWCSSMSYVPDSCGCCSSDRSLTSSSFAWCLVAPLGLSSFLLLPLATMLPGILRCQAIWPEIHCLSLGLPAWVFQFSWSTLLSSIADWFPSQGLFPLDLSRWFCYLSSLPISHPTSAFSTHREFFVSGLWRPRRPPEWHCVLLCPCFSATFPSGILRLLAPSPSCFPGVQQCPVGVSHSPCPPRPM